MHFVPQTTPPPVLAVAGRCRVGIAHGKSCLPVGAASSRDGAGLGREVCFTKVHSRAIEEYRVRLGLVAEGRTEFGRPSCR
jgi:hypothetical protein